MLFSKFLKQGGKRLFDAYSSRYITSTDITINTNTNNVHIIEPSSDVLVTISDPSITTLPSNHIVANVGSSDITIDVGGVTYPLYVDNVLYLNWSGSSWVITDSDIIDQTVIPMTEYKIVASDAETQDHFGIGVTMSGDGERCLVGARLEDTGADDAGSAYIYKWSGTSWDQESRIQPSNVSLSGYFGYSVSMNDDGSKCIISAYSYSGTSSTAGAAYIFSRSGTTWTEEQKLEASNIGNSDFFGYSVAMSGDGTRCIVGAPQEDTAGTNAGSVYVFLWNGSSWVEEQIIQSSDAQSGDVFGWSVDISVDGSRCIVGSEYEDTGGSNAGAAYIFSRSGTTWAEEQKIQSNDVDTNDRFGWCVSINDDGDKCLVGSYVNDTFGASYFFTRSGTIWSQNQKLISGDADSDDQYAKTVSLSGDGFTCVIGAPYDDGAGTNTGAIYIYKWNGSSWAQDQKINTSDGEIYDAFGISVSVSGDGSRCVAGAYIEDTLAENAGATYIYHNI